MRELRLLADRDQPQGIRRHSRPRQSHGKASLLTSGGPRALRYSWGLQRAPLHRPARPLAPMPTADRNGATRPRRCKGPALVGRCARRLISPIFSAAIAGVGRCGPTTFGARTKRWLASSHITIGHPQLGGSGCGISEQPVDSPSTAPHPRPCPPDPPDTQITPSSYGRLGSNGRVESSHRCHRP